MQKVLVLFVLCLCHTMTFAQNWEAQTTDLLDKVSVATTHTDTKQRVAAFHALNEALLKVLEQPQSGQQAFDSLRSGRIVTVVSDSMYNPFTATFDYAYTAFPVGIAITEAPDKAFRLFTTRVYVSANDYLYGGVLQLASGKVIALKDQSATMDALDLPYLTLSPDQWYGAVYYNCKAFDTPAGKKYLLFGFDNFSQQQQRKVAEVLTLQGDQVTFGAPVFAKKEANFDTPTLYNRLLLEYGAGSAARLNYDEDLKCIVYDHLVPLETRKGTPSAIMVSDGSYEGYTLSGKDGVWIYFEKLPTQIVDEAPREQPIFGTDKPKRTILGQPKER